MTYRYPGGLIRRTAANTAITGASGVWDLGSQAQAVKNNTWPISGLANPISASLRFRASASAYLDRTFPVAGNRKTYTLSLWVKRGILDGSTNQFFFGSGASATAGGFYFLPTNELEVNPRVNNTNTFLTTTQVFRDSSAWYHIVFQLDTTQATSSDRMKLYVNGVQVTAFSTASYPALNGDSTLNNNIAHWIGRYAEVGFPSPFDGYLAEYNFIDGQALTPSYFGQTSAITGVWEPIKYTGTYGTNGFYLSLSDTSSIGKDFSGNGNNWTPNNISTTSGSTFDLMRDVPTQYTPQGATDVGGTVRGNYCVLNPLTTTAGTYSNANLRYVGTSSYRRSNATISVSTGKWYWEVTLGNAPFSPRASNSQNNAFGFGLSTVFNSTTNITSVTDAVVLADSGYYKNFSGSFTDGGTAFSSGDTLAVAVDLDINTFTFYHNNTQITTGTIGGTAGRELVPIIISYDGVYGVMDCNFGQRPFTYAPPSGFKSLCTTNLPTPTIGATTATAANKYFDATLYTGTGATLSVTNAGGFQPDMVWLKSRSAATNHQLFDAVRGTTKVIVSNTTESESTSANTITSFNSGGFTVGTNTAINTSAATYVGWQWWAGGSTVTNTSGSITSTVRASTTAGFSVVTYIGNGTGGATIGHGLGAAPGMLMFKNRDETGGNSILVWHSSFTNQEQMLLSSTATIYNPGNGLYFNSTTPGASVVTLGTSGSTNPSAVNMLMYAWTPIAGFSSFGKYTGNGSADGPFVFTGFRPRFVITKSSDATAGIGDWTIHDTSRLAYNTNDLRIFANASSAESTSEAMDMLSNGFKIRATNSNCNTSSGGYIYMAFAEFPFKNSLAR